MQPEGESRHGIGEHLPPHALLPDLAPPVERFFHQLGESGSERG